MNFSQYIIQNAVDTSTRGIDIGHSRPCSADIHLLERIIFYEMYRFLSLWHMVAYNTLNFVLDGRFHGAPPLVFSGMYPSYIAMYNFSCIYYRFITHISHHFILTSSLLYHRVCFYPPPRRGLALCLPAEALPLVLV